ncbi:PIN (PilT N terminus) domain protein [gamma proteobacterium HdN1]|nr:PIN (PilT N terminus) domain protein [gamma proteobacterium HdN1]
MATPSGLRPTLSEAAAAGGYRANRHAGAGTRQGQTPPSLSPPVMRMYLLDTNIVSELRKPKPHGGVLAWLNSVEDAHLHIATVTLGEIQAGIELTRDQDPEKAAEIERWVDQVAEAYNVLAMDGPSFRCWAKLMHKKSDTLYEDAMIASIATTNGLTVVTRNTSDFSSFGVPLLNPFEFRS